MRGSNETGYFHICTDGNAVPWIFQDDEDFIAGVNRIAICKLITGVTVVCFILMDNHLHILLYGTVLKCKAFINNYKRLTGIWISRKYCISEYLKHLPSEIIPITSEESLLNTIAYIDRNSIVAGYRYMPREYPWGTARYIFQDPSCREMGSSVSLSDLTVRARRSLLKSRVTVPTDWDVDSRGMILPKYFVDISRLERIFKSPSRYSYFLAKKLEGEIEMSMENSKKTFLNDKELREVTRTLIINKFGVSDKELDIKSKLVIAKELRYNYLSTVKQISRMLSLSEDLLKNFI
jgi:hypothetical protein